MGLKARDRLEKECLNSWHSDAGLSEWFSPLEFNPRCPTCMARETLAMHDHLFCGNDAKCLTPGFTGVPGSMVKCECGSFHHWTGLYKRRAVWYNGTNDDERNHHEHLRTFHIASDLQAVR